MPGPRKKTVRLPDGNEITGTVVPFHNSVEEFNEYMLDDGTVLQVKLVLTEVLRLDDTWDDQGQPVYWMNHQVVNSLQVPDTLKRQDG